MAKFCSNCGASLEAETKFCPKCGTPVEHTSAGATTQVNNTYNGTYPKSRMVAGLLGIFLGAWGIHNFYLGYSGKGILQIILTICTCGIAGIWGFIEGILILCGNINIDADGNQLTN